VKVHERPNETTNTAAIFKNVCADSLAALAAAATRAAGDVSSVVVFVQGEMSFFIPFMYAITYLTTAPPKEMESKKSALSQGTPSASNAG
jgi:Mn2+/Fe2+ NRAMP family transporter